MSQASKLTGRSSASSSRLPGAARDSRPLALCSTDSSEPSAESVTRRCAFSSVRPSTRTSSSALDATRGPERRGRVERIADDLAPREPDRVDERLPRAGERVRTGLDRGEIALGVRVHEADRRARQDVVELLQQEQLPQPVELGARIVAAQAREELGVVQRLLAAAVAALRARLRGVDAAVVLEVELARDDRAIAALGLERVEELLARALRRARQALQVARPPERLEHVPRRAAAAVAEAEDEQARARVVVILVLARGLEQLGHVTSLL